MNERMVTKFINSIIRQQGPSRASSYGSWCTTVVYGYGSSSICGGAMRSYRSDVTGSDRKWRQSRDRKRPCSEAALFGGMYCACATGSCAISTLVGPFSPQVTKSRDRKRPCPALLPPRTFCFPYFFPVFSSVLFSRIFSPYSFFPYYFFPVLFFRTFSKVATFEIQRFKILVSCFSSTCRYNTVYVPCGISIQTSPVGLPLDGWIYLT